MGIDGWINNKPCSVKSFKYARSAYKRVASKDIEKEVLNGAPIITYKIIDGKYRIINLKEVEAFYK